MPPSCVPMLFLTFGLITFQSDLVFACGGVTHRIIGTIFLPVGLYISYMQLIAWKLITNPCLHEFKKSE